LVCCTFLSYAFTETFADPIIELPSDCRSGCQCNILFASAGIGRACDQLFLLESLKTFEEFNLPTASKNAEQWLMEISDWIRHRFGGKSFLWMFRIF
jgi:hypothetical protein